MKITLIELKSLIAESVEAMLSEVEPKPGFEDYEADREVHTSRFHESEPGDEDIIPGDDELSSWEQDYPQSPDLAVKPNEFPADKALSNAMRRDKINAADLTSGNQKGFPGGLGAAFVKDQASSARRGLDAALTDAGLNDYESERDANGETDSDIPSESELRNWDNYAKPKAPRIPFNQTKYPPPDPSSEW